VGGVDVVYKDVVEPLESVSVTITPTEKKDVTEFGDIADVSGCGWQRQFGPVCLQQQQQVQWPRAIGQSVQ
jgi:alkylated DNA nucleotide flippase Atl1